MSVVLNTRTRNKQQASIKLCGSGSMRNMRTSQAQYNSANLCLCLDMYMYTCTYYVSMYMSTCICMCTCTYLYVYVCICRCIGIKHASTKHIHSLSYHMRKRALHTCTACVSILCMTQEYDKAKPDDEVATLLLLSSSTFENGGEWANIEHQYVWVWFHSTLAHCMYICMHLCMRICIHARMHACMHVC